ncbi:BQ2448_5054 [Microbotryum intermedium]|uniref:BQ2448_5054 protein n=1 Tax=Microbotryum intermedium TaxID=269621 RepID=A0A238F647_9BASI|nr:BQ2448_5054 [Microbotryum intermedium]
MTTTLPPQAALTPSGQGSNEERVLNPAPLFGSEYHDPAAKATHLQVPSLNSAPLPNPLVTVDTSQPPAPPQAVNQPISPSITTQGAPKVSTLQANVDKVKEQLNKRGGKTGATLASALQGQADALAKVNIVGDIYSNGTPVEYHVHNAGGMFSKDDVVLNAQGQPLFYLSFPHTPLHSSWSLSLHHGSRDGPLLATLTKSSYGLQKDDITISFSLPSGAPFKTVLARPSLISKAHDFTGIGGGKFKWKGDGPLSQGLKCIDLQSGHIAATWEKSYSYGKDGKMLISPAYAQNELFTIIATGLAMEGTSLVDCRK